MARITPVTLRSSWYTVELLDERLEGHEVIVTARIIHVNHWHPMFWWSLAKSFMPRRIGR